MTSIKVYYDPNVMDAPVVIAGDPPDDQTQTVADLQAQVATLTTDKNTLTTQVTHLQSEIQQAKDNAAALVTGLND